MYVMHLISRDPLLCQYLETQFMEDIRETEQIIGRPWNQHIVEVAGWL